MNTLWSPSQLAIFIEGVSSRIPTDSVLIESTTYGSLMQELSLHPLNTLADDGGKPVVVKCRTDEDNAVIDNEIQQLTLINEASWHIELIKPAVDGGYATPEHTKLLADWQRYRYELTLVSEQPGWPESPHWPTEPARII